MFNIMIQTGDNYELLAQATTYSDAMQIKEMALEIQKVDPSMMARIEIHTPDATLSVPDMDELYRDMQVALDGEWTNETLTDAK